MLSLIRPVLSNSSKILIRGGDRLISTSKMASTYETLSVTVPKEFVYKVELNRPDKLNALNNAMVTDIQKCFTDLNSNPDCRVIVLSGAGRLFMAGLDLTHAVNLGSKLAEVEDIARKARILHYTIKKMQESFGTLEKCTKPVLACVHSGCIGAGVDLIVNADIRYCSKDAYFQVKEIDIGMAADVSTLQILPKIIGSQSLVRELCYTGRKLPADEALKCGLVSEVFDDKEKLVEGALKVAEEIASKSPVAVQSTKVALLYARDHTVQDSLHQIASWNQAMLQSEDFINATLAQATKQGPVKFAKL